MPPRPSVGACSGALRGATVTALDVVASLTRWAGDLPRRAVRTLSSFEPFQDATQRAVAEAEERWRLALEGAEDGVWDWDVPSSRVHFSSGWKRMLGHTDDEVGDGLDEWEKRVHPEDMPDVLDALTPHLEGKTRSYESVHRVLHADGSYIWIRDRGSVVRRAPDGSPLRVVGTHTDVTEHQRLLAALRASEDRYRTVMAAVAEGVVVQDAQSRPVLWNDAALHILGLTDEQMAGTSSHDPRWRTVRADGSPMPVDEHPATVCQRTGRPVRRALLGLDVGNGDRRWLMVSAEPLFEPGNPEPHAVVTSTSDVTALLRAQERSALGAAVFAGTAEAILVIEQDRIAAVNPAFTALTGFRAHEVVGRSPSLLLADTAPHAVVIPGADGPAGGQGPEGVGPGSPGADGGAWNGELWLRRPDGSTFAVQGSASTIPGDGGTHRLVVVLHDITDRKVLERTLWQQANYDLLTGLPNRHLLLDRIERAIARADRSGRSVGVLFCDLDGFKAVNDRMGHAAGDELLVAVAQRLTTTIRGEDTVARYGGDEFCFVVGEIAGRAEAENVAAKIEQALLRPFLLGTGPASIGASVGVACFPTDGDRPEQLIDIADDAMYRVKSDRKATSPGHWPRPRVVFSAG